MRRALFVFWRLAMPYTKNEKTAMIVGGIVTAGVIGLVIAVVASDDEPAGKKKAAFEPPDPSILIPSKPATLIPTEPATPPPAIVVPGKLFDPDVFTTSPRDCSRTDEGFNTEQWSLDPLIGPENAAAALRALGFPIDAAEILASDKMRPKQLRIWDSGLVAGTPSAALEFFQTVARSRALPGYGTAKDKNIDGLVGECTLQSLSAAVTRFNTGTWPPV